MAFVGKKMFYALLMVRVRKAARVQEHHWFYTLKVRVFLGNNTVMSEN